VAVGQAVKAGAQRIPAQAHYHSFLAEAWPARRDDGFWKFHARGLATVGDAIDRPRTP